MTRSIPDDVMQMLNRASGRTVRTASVAPKFKCSFLSPEWNSFVETWAPKCYAFVSQALGGYPQEPKTEILAIPEGYHASGVNASYQPDNGQIRLVASIVEGQPGATLEKLTHELIHSALASFPEGDPFYEEGFVDYSVWVMSHAPAWGTFQKAMQTSAEFNIECRRDRALRDTSDYDRKRWAGGLFCSLTHGPWIVSRLKMRKDAGEFVW
jgi:hypothetical protein